MNILYLSDMYAWDQFGVKRSLYESLCDHAQVTFVDYKETYPQVCFEKNAARLPDGPLFAEAFSGRYSHIFFASSCLAFEPHLMKRLKRVATLVGFGFSDPRFVETTYEHWHFFDAYFSLSPAVAQHAQAQGLAAGCMLPSIHPGFHDRFCTDHETAEYDAIFFGNIETHPDSELRRQTLEKLEMNGLRVLTVGRGGMIDHTEGVQALQLLANARIGINVMGKHSTLPHRIFEYTAANNCLLTTRTDTVASCFSMDSEAIDINDRDVIDKLRDKAFCRDIAQKGRQRCLNEHTITSRKLDILAKLNLLDSYAQSLS